MVAGTRLTEKPRHEVDGGDGIPNPKRNTCEHSFRAPSPKQSQADTTIATGEGPAMVLGTPAAGRRPRSPKGSTLGKAGAAKSSPRTAAVN